MPTTTLAELLNWNQRIMKEEAALVKSILTSRKSSQQGEEPWSSEMLTTEYQGSQPRQFKTRHWHAFHNMLDGQNVPKLDMRSLSEAHQKDDLPVTSRADTKRETVNRAVQVRFSGSRTHRGRLQETQQEDLGRFFTSRRSNNPNFENQTPSSLQMAISMQLEPLESEPS